MKYGDPRRSANRARFLFGAGLEDARVLGLDLSHSRKVIFPSESGDAADGIVLAPDLGLAASVTVADCMPIWILDRGSGAFGILHSGWRGTGILAVAVRAMAERLGSAPDSMAVILGPAIGPCCYSVPAERAAKFSAEFGAAAVSRRGDGWRLDLRSANVSIAEGLGIGRVLSIEACSSCDERLGSYRRQGPTSFTRMIAVCGRSPRAPGLLAGGASE
jgi:hypothetical protein